MWWTYYILMYEKGKMRPAEPIPGMRVGVTMENGGQGEFCYDIL
jgi:hypothetical protein